MKGVQRSREFSEVVGSDNYLRLLHKYCSACDTSPDLRVWENKQVKCGCWSRKNELLAAAWLQRAGVGDGGRVLSADMEKRGSERKVVGGGWGGGRATRGERAGESQRPLSASRSAVFRLGQVSNWSELVLFLSQRVWKKNLCFKREIIFCFLCLQIDFVLALNQQPRRCR